MTVDLVAIAAAVDAAVPDAARADWQTAARRRLSLFVRRPVRRVCGAPFGHSLTARAPIPSQGVRGSCPGTPSRDDRALAGAIRSAFRDLGGESPAETVFVRVTRSFLSGDLPVPRHPDRVVVEVDGVAPCDSAVLDGLLRLKALGCRVQVADFTGRGDQRRVLPFADFVKIDCRDLDVEGRPLLDLAASRGAVLVADFVDTAAAIADCRTAGFALVQGRALEEPAPRFHASLLSSAAGL